MKMIERNLCTRSIVLQNDSLLVISDEHIRYKLLIDDHPIEQIVAFNYLGLDEPPT